MCGSRVEVPVKGHLVLFIAALFLLAPKWKQLTWPLADEWINQMWYIHTMGYHLAIIRNDTPIYAAIWMNLENLA